MKRVAFLLVLCSALASGTALAGKSSVKAGGGHRAHHGGHHHHHGGHRHHGHGHHRHASVFVGFGWGWWYPPAYYPAYYPYYTPVAYPAQPVTYIEQYGPPVEHWWYYCEAARGYYPHVRECPSLWQRVPAVPPR